MTLLRCVVRTSYEFCVRRHGVKGDAETQELRPRIPGVDFLKTSDDSSVTDSPPGVESSQESRTEVVHTLLISKLLQRLVRQAIRAFSNTCDKYYGSNIDPFLLGMICHKYRPLQASAGVREHEILIRLPFDSAFRVSVL